MKEAIDLGFSNAAVMDTKKLVFVPEYRNFCEENRCGCYNLNPACPPSCGTAEEMKQRAFRYKNTLVLQTTLEDSKDPAQYKKDKLRHNIMTEKLAGKMEAEGITDILIMTDVYKRQVLYMAGFCDWFENEKRFVILTTKANASMEKTHDRMPLILEKEQLADWFDDKKMEQLLQHTPVMLKREAEYEQQSLFL